MNDVNPYEGPHAPDPQKPGKPARMLGTCVGILGTLTLAYGIVGFFVLPQLPPNNAVSGRMNSIYVMGIGAVLLLVGLALRDLRLGGTRTTKAPTKQGEVSTGYGLLILVAIVVVAIIVISQM